MVRLAVLIIFVATLAGALMPSVVPEREPERTKVIRVDGLRATATRPQSSDSGTGAVTLSRSPDGHFYADVQVNGTMVNFMVDTGATGIALTHDDARRAGVMFHGDPEVIGSGASGEVWGHIVRLNRVELGPKLASDTPAVVLEGGDRSLLGQSFLSRFGSVEIHGDLMTLR